MRHIALGERMFKQTKTTRKTDQQICCQLANYNHDHYYWNKKHNRSWNKKKNCKFKKLRLKLLVNFKGSARLIGRSVWSHQLIWMTQITKWIAIMSVSCLCSLLLCVCACSYMANFCGSLHTTNRRFQSTLNLTIIDRWQITYKVQHRCRGTHYTWIGYKSACVKLIVVSCDAMSSLNGAWYTWWLFVTCIHCAPNLHQTKVTNSIVKLMCVSQCFPARTLLKYWQTHPAIA